MGFSESMAGNNCSYLFYVMLSLIQPSEVQHAEPFDYPQHYGPIPGLGVCRGVGASLLSRFTDHQLPTPVLVGWFADLRRVGVRD